MNIRIDIDISPQELREFFGLPDVRPLQEEMMEKVRDQMIAGMEQMDPTSLMRAGLPAHLQNVEAFQRALWNAMTGTSSSKSDD